MEHIVRRSGSRRPSSTSGRSCAIRRAGTTGCRAGSARTSPGRTTRSGRRTSRTMKMMGFERKADVHGRRGGATEAHPRAHRPGPPGHLLPVRARRRRDPRHRRVRLPDARAYPRVPQEPDDQELFRAASASHARRLQGARRGDGPGARLTRSKPSSHSRARGDHPAALLRDFLAGLAGIPNFVAPCGPCRRSVGYQLILAISRGAARPGRPARGLADGDADPGLNRNRALRRPVCECPPAPARQEA